MENKSTLQWYRAKERPEAINWHVGDWGSRLLVRARTGTLEVKARSRDEQDQNCKFCRDERETIEHLIVECHGYEQQRGRLIGAMVGILGETEWQIRRETVDRGSPLCWDWLVVRKKGIELQRKPQEVFIIQAWETRQSN